MELQFTFRQLSLDEFDQAYEILYQADQWLQQQGYEHYLIPKESYYQRCTLGYNYGLFKGASLCMVRSILPQWPSYLEEYRPKIPFVWCESLAINREFAGQNLGRIMRAKCDSYIVQQGIYDSFSGCFYGNGFLPKYYQSMGERIVARMTVILPDGKPRDGVLIHRKVIPNNKN